MRRIFSQAVKPLLLMISEFITIGSFKDPYNEFFVEKLYRNKQKNDADGQGQAATSGHGEDDYIYKITNDADKIPVFLGDTAVTIFKIGCDLNLLKTKREEILSETTYSM